MERLIIKIESRNVPKGVCSYNLCGILEQVASCGNCDGTYDDCEFCSIQECLNKLATYERAHEEIESRIKEIKASTNYPHNFMGQMVDDLEWVLSLLEKRNGGVV